MANTVTMLDKLSRLIDDMEEEIIDSGYNHGFYNGVEYTRRDFNNMRCAIKRVQGIYKIGSKKSTTYIKKNPEYNKMLNRLRYYKRKLNKSPHDYQMIEQLTKELDCYKKLKRDKKVNNKPAEEEILEKMKERYGFYG